MATSWTRRIGLAFGGLLALVLIVVGTIIVLSGRNLNRRYEVTPEVLTVPTDSVTLERGRHLATAITKCSECHGEDLGGQRMDLGPVGTFPAGRDHRLRKVGATG